MRHCRSTCRARQRTRQCVKHILMHGTAIAKTYFGFGRMHVHIHQRGVEFQK